MKPGPNRRSRSKARNHPSQSESALNHAVRLVHHVCCIAGAHSLIDDIRSEGAPGTLGSMIERNDTPGLFDWLVGVLSFQGISDRVASAYIDEHGSVTWAEIERLLSKKPSCPKLKSYWQFEGCGYQKAKRTCSTPQHYSRCPLPKHRLRNGRLNQTAYGLFLFLRDIAESDLVSWIDTRLSQAKCTLRPNRDAATRESLLGPLRHIYGVADKVLSLALASILLAAHDSRTHWHDVGGTMLAIDTLVHRFLYRTGILTRLDANHAYGPRCYEKNGCAGIIEKIAGRIIVPEGPGCSLSSGSTKLF